MINSFLLRVLRRSKRHEGWGQAGGLSGAQPAALQPHFLEGQRNGFASKAKQAKRAAAAAQSSGAGVSGSADEEVPELRVIMRRLAFLVHPDRMPGASAAAAENAQSLADLQGVLSTVQRSRDEHPKAGVRRLRFHIPVDPTAEGSAGRMRVVEAALKTTGGDCRHIVERSLAQLFGACGLPNRFKWSENDWEMENDEDKEAKRQHDRQSEDERARLVQQGEREASAAAASNRAAEAPPPPRPTHGANAAALAAARAARAASSEPIPPLQQQLAKIDPLLRGLAGVPWVPDTPEGATMRNQMALTLAQLEDRHGWRIRSAVHNIWAGATELETATAALSIDPASREALKMVLYHTHAIERELGPRLRVGLPAASGPRAAGGGGAPAAEPVSAEPESAERGSAERGGSAGESAAEGGGGEAPGEAGRAEAGGSGGGVGGGDGAR